MMIRLTVVDDDFNRCVLFGSQLSGDESLIALDPVSVIFNLRV